MSVRAARHPAARAPRRRALGVALVAALAFAGCRARAEPVALTFDDLPALSLDETAASARLVTRRLTSGLTACRAPATGFVVGGKLAERPRVRDQLLRAWRRKGLALGNHTWSHASLNDTPAADYIAEIARTDRLLRGLEPGRPPRTLWFRHPYLETGPTEAARAAVAAWLDAHGYRIAPVTLETDDDLFNAPYEAAVRAHDRRGAAEVLAAYLAFTRARIAWYRSAGETLFGRRPALVALMHATRLNADAMPQLCSLIRRAGLQPVPLETAMRDPAYRLPDGPAQADGDDWFNRWAGLLQRDLPWDSFPEAPAKIQAAAQALDPEPPHDAARPTPTGTGGAARAPRGP